MVLAPDSTAVGNALRRLSELFSQVIEARLPASALEGPSRTAPSNCT
jgi:hypothetical protein